MYLSIYLFALMCQSLVSTECRYSDISSE